MKIIIQSGQYGTLLIFAPFPVQSKREEMRTQIVNRYRLTAKKDHENILMRRQIIEERKEEIENLNVKRVRREQIQYRKSRTGD